MSEDHVRDPTDDTWNRLMLEHWARGQFEQAEAKIPLFAKEARVDMGFKAYAFLRGMHSEPFRQPAKVLGYSAIYGTGGAVVKFTGGAS
jgi:2-aminophenol/2-amino-5-chlorophenol 1,6-dioxygenase alpha subunit